MTKEFSNQFDLKKAYEDLRTGFKASALGGGEILIILEALDFYKKEVIKVSGNLNLGYDNTVSKLLDNVIDLEEKLKDCMAKS